MREILGTILFLLLLYSSLSPFKSGVRKRGKKTGQVKDLKKGSSVRVKEAKAKKTLLMQVFYSFPSFVFSSANGACTDGDVAKPKGLENSCVAIVLGLRREDIFHP